jgi:hypothetical protein
VKKLVTALVSASLILLPFGGAYAQSNTGQGIKEDAKEAKAAIKSDAKTAKKEIKSDAKKVKKATKKKAKKVKRKVKQTT